MELLKNLNKYFIWDESVQCLLFSCFRVMFKYQMTIWHDDQSCSDVITSDHATVETWVHISATEEELEYSGGHTEEYLQGGGVVLE